MGSEIDGLDPFRSGVRGGLRFGDCGLRGAVLGAEGVESGMVVDWGIFGLVADCA